MKRLIVRSTASIVILVVSLLFLASTASPIMAEEVQTCTQVSQYGGGVGIVCGAKHEPVETGLADINPLVLASIFFSLAGYGMYQYRKLQKLEISLN